MEITIKIINSAIVKLSSYKLNSFQLKIIGVFLMILDHSWAFFYNIFPFWFTELGRIVAPLFLYLSIFGFYMSSNKLRYILRLGIAGVIMGCMNLLFVKFLLNYYNLNLAFTFFSPNIFFSIGLSLLLIYIFEKIINSNSSVREIALYVSLLVLFISLYTYVEGEFGYLGIGIAMYIGRKDKFLASYLLIIWSAFVYFQFNFLGNFLLTAPHQWMFVYVIPFLFLYSGKKTKSLQNQFLVKYFFYFFYPLHIYTIGLIWAKFGLH